MRSTPVLLGLLAALALLAINSLGRTSTTTSSTGTGTGTGAGGSSTRLAEGTKDVDALHELVIDLGKVEAELETARRAIRQHAPPLPVPVQHVTAPPPPASRAGCTRGASFRRGGVAFAAPRARRHQNSCL